MATLAAPHTAPGAPPAALGWTMVARAMGATGGASLAGGLLSLLASKIVAVVAGPAAIGVLSTLQQVRAAAVTAGTLNGATALVQGASALDGSARREFLRTALGLMSAATLFLAGALVAAPEWAAHWAGLGAARAPLLRLLAVPLVLAAVYVFLAALLTALGAIRPLAVAQLAAPAALAAGAWPVARRLSEGSEIWLVVWLGASGLAAAGVAAALLLPHRTRLAEWFGGRGRWWSWSAARHFLKISGVLFTSGLLYSGAVIGVRAGILRAQGLETTGHFDAAWTIGMNQATLVLASLQTYYLPVLARRGEEARRAAHIRRVVVLAAGASAVLLAGLIVSKPLVLSLLYSPEFSPAARYLRWTLAGDYLKITSWILSVPLLAAADMRMFLIADLCSYAAFLGSAVLLGRWYPAADSAAMAFAAMYAVHLVVCGARLWLTRVFRPDSLTFAVWLTGLALVAGVSAVFWSAA